MTDNINHPAHYTAYPVEVIQLTEHLNFCRGNAVKYIARAGLKNPATEVEDLRKAAWYIAREIERLTAGQVRSGEVRWCNNHAERGPHDCQLHEWARAERVEKRP